MDTARARDLLTAELAELDERAAFADDTAREAAADPVGREGALGQHPGDYGAEVTGRMESRQLAETVDVQRRRIREALDRVDDGSFGRCTVCGRPIDDERLEARPEAETCRDHA